MTISVRVVDASMRALARRLLPPTRRVVLGGGRAYFFYWTSGPAAPMAFEDLEGAPLIRCQTFATQEAAEVWMLADYARSRVVGVS